jgi:DNA phosphorothioation-dependent restriction protein DptG
MRVDPDAIRDFAEELSVLRSCADSAAHQARYTDPQPSGGALLLRLMDQCADVEANVRALFAHFERILDESVTELRATARDYEDTDRASAATSTTTQGRL